MIEYFLLFIFMGICVCIAAMARRDSDDSEDWRDVSYPTQQSSPSGGPRVFSRYKQRYPRRRDSSSSPIGGKCLNCGASVQDETTLQCPSCGAARQRCPICQRFVTADQDLLACPHCETLGHANEMELWVHEENKCPYCGRNLRILDLQQPKLRPKKPVKHPVKTRKKRRSKKK